jgi:nicotinate-nucleotide pyrophosphorylase (carboxylating)
MACGGIKQALSKAIDSNPDKLLEIEVESLDELQLALDGKAQVIMLDNFSLKHMNSARKITDEHSTQAKLEASGNVRIETVQAIAKTGVDYISVGALTKDISAIDLSLRIQLAD